MLDIHHSSVNSPCGSDDDIAERHIHLGCRIRVRDRNNCALRICFGVHDPNVAQCLQVEESSVDRSCHFLVHFIGEPHALVSS